MWASLYAIPPILCWLAQSKRLGIGESHGRQPRDLRPDGRAVLEKSVAADAVSRTHSVTVHCQATWEQTWGNLNFFRREN